MKGEMPAVRSFDRLALRRLLAQMARRQLVCQSWCMRPKAVEKAKSTSQVAAATMLRKPNISRQVEWPSAVWPLCDYLSLSRSYSDSNGQKDVFKAKLSRSELVPKDVLARYGRIMVGT